MLIDRIKDGYLIGGDEALEIVQSYSVEQLCKIADELRIFFDGDDFDSCSIINARSGRCSEDCKWCSQSKFYNTNIEIYPLLKSEKVMEMARYNHAKGIKRFSLVTSGKALTPQEIDQLVPIFKQMSDELPTSLCASMGLLSYSELEALYSAGCSRYHCNLESAPSYFGNLCSTHTQQQKIETIKNAQKVGMSICSGGILGMGESMEQRIELALILREIGVDSIPINVLNPIPGTPLEGMAPLSDDELLRSIAIFKIIDPKALIRFAGGRSRFTHIQEKALRSGVCGAIMGDMLTTIGADIDSDFEMIDRVMG